MATFDQLAADQRAIIELVLQRSRSYEQIGEMLDLPPARVRELARAALAELAPSTAELVDEQWRGQLADYVLGQQTGPESQATRGHLRRSEPARIWAYSLLDALDDFFDDGQRPEIPAGESGGRAAVRERPPAADGEAAIRSPLGTPRRLRAGAGLSPAARSALMRRRLGGGVAAALIVALLVFGALKLFGGDDANEPAAGTGTGTGTSTAQGQGQVVAQAVLAPVGKDFDGQGAAFVYATGGQSLAIVQAKLPPTKGRNKYVLWLYNNDRQLVPLAADVTDKQGNFRGAARMPQGWQNYRFIDVTYQPTSGKNVGHGRSVMRGPLTEPQQPSGGTNGTGSSGSAGGSGGGGTGSSGSGSGGTGTGSSGSGGG